MIQRLSAPASQLSHVVDLHEQVQLLTETIFGSRPNICADSDPETDEKYFVVTVEAEGEVADIVKQNDEWHRRLCNELGEEARFFRLLLDIQ